jgi:hypothetical protein
VYSERVIGLLLVAAVTVHVEEARDVSAAQIDVVVSSLKAALSALDRDPSDQPAKVLTGESCRARPSCMEKLLQGGDDALLVHIFGAVTTIGLLLERVSSKGDSNTVQLSLLGDESARADAIRGAVLDLFPRTAPPKPSRELVAAEVTTPRARDRSAAPWFVVGGGLAAGAASAILWGTAASDLDALRGKLNHEPGAPITAISYSSAISSQDSISLRRNASGSLLAIAAAAVVGGILWLWLGE